jgi:hypothetical protein
VIDGVVSPVDHKRFEPVAVSTDEPQLFTELTVGADGAEGSTNEILNELEEQPLLNTIEYAPASKPEIVYGSVTDEDPLIAPDQESVPVPEPDTEIVPLFTAQELGFDDPLDAIEGTALGAAVADAAVLVHPDTD